MQKRTVFITGLILVAALSRLIPHPLNFTPVGALSLFGAAYLSDRKWAYLMPIIAMWFSDLFVNNIMYASYYEGFVFFTEGVIWIYASILLIASLGIFILNKVSVPRVLLTSVAASYIFFLITNFGVWASGLTYPMTFEGLVACYTAAIPFFKNTLFGDLFYCAALFGIYELLRIKFPRLAVATSS